MNARLSIVETRDSEGCTEMNKNGGDKKSANRKIIKFDKNFRSDNEELIGIEGKNFFYRFIKRLFDIILSSLALVILLPLFLIIAVAIKLEDGEPVVFKQERSGLNGKIFKMYKFRSMVKNAPQLHESLLEKNELDGPAFKMKDDPRITRVGKIIRKTSMDELPQLVNIIKGDMSIVGPRPLPVYETEKCNEYQNQRLLMKPGLTCYWQVMGRNDVGFDEWVELDLKYIRRAGIFTDLGLIIMTFGAVLSGKGAE